jgi:multiple sugar transport system permease protein
MKNSLVSVSVNITKVVFLLFSTIVMIFPIVLMLITSVKTMNEIMSPRFVFIPAKLMFQNFSVAMATGDWPKYFMNSIIIVIWTVAVGLVITSLCGYSLARLNFRGRDTIFKIFLLGLMIPPQVTMLPNFFIMKYMPFAGGNNAFGIGGMGLINTHAGIIIPIVAGSFGVFLFRQFFLNFPQSLDDAAKIDGLNPVMRFIKIYIPLSIPVFATFIVLKSNSTWNEYTWPLLMTSVDEMKTVQLAFQVFQDEVNVQWNLLMAATTVITMPMILIFLVAQKYFIEGITTTGTKG